MPENLRLEEIIKRKNKFVVNGKQFPIPRAIRREIFYEKHYLEPNELRIYGNGEARRFVAPWNESLSARQVFRSKKRLRFPDTPLPLYRKALDYEGNLYHESALTKLRQDSKTHADLSFRQLCQGLQGFELASCSIRESFAEASYTDSLKSQKDNQ